jgi:hypothetical protein
VDHERKFISANAGVRDYRKHLVTQSFRRDRFPEFACGWKAFSFYDIYILIVKFEFVRSPISAVLFQTTSDDAQRKFFGSKNANEDASPEKRRKNFLLTHDRVSSCRKNLDGLFTGNRSQK